MSAMKRLLLEQEESLFCLPILVTPEGNYIQFPSGASYDVTLLEELLHDKWSFAHHSQVLDQQLN